MTVSPKMIKSVSENITSEANVVSHQILKLKVLDYEAILKMKNMYLMLDQKCENVLF